MKDILLYVLISHSRGKFRFWFHSVHPRCLSEFLEKLVVLAQLWSSQATLNYYCPLRRTGFVFLGTATSDWLEFMTYARWREKASIFSHRHHKNDVDHEARYRRPLDCSRRGLFASHQLWRKPHGSSHEHGSCHRDQGEFLLLFVLVRILSTKRECIHVYFFAWFLLDSLCEITL